MPRATARTGRAQRTVIDWAGVISGLSAIESADGNPTTVFLSTGAAQDLRLQKLETGEYVGMPQAVRDLDLRWVTSARVPAGKLIVVDASRVLVGVRTDVRLLISEHVLARKDAIYFRATYRVGNRVVVAGDAAGDPTAVQIVSPAASWFKVSPGLWVEVRPGVFPPRLRGTFSRPNELYRITETTREEREMTNHELVEYLKARSLILPQSEGGCWL